MSRSCNLIVDSCCDLPLELLQSHEGVTIMNFCYILDSTVYPDDFFQTRGVKEFYDLLRNGAMPTTSQVAPKVLEDTFREACASGVPTVYLSMSSGVSSNYSSACMIRDKVKADYPLSELYVVDSLLASTSEGVLVLGAIDKMEAGATAKELVNWAEEARFRAHIEFMVDDLDTLHRGGRLPRSVALAGGALNIKPLLQLNDKGTLGMDTAARGRKKGLKALLNYFEEHRDETKHTVLVGNADSIKDAEALREGILAIDPAAEVIIHTVGTTIGSHTGPGMVSIGFWGDDRHKPVKKGLFGRRK
ncbi:MAG: DegV family protein [Coriobacteriia bacterium]|nr:DegV family protein [Coriobacteriia bacterium]